MNITLKAKYFRLIYHFVKDSPSQTLDTITYELKTKILPSLDNDDEETVATSMAQIEYIWKVISDLPEWLMAKINKEMEDALEPQVIAGIMAEDPEFIALGTFIATRKAERDARIANLIEYGKQALEIYQT